MVLTVKDFVASTGFRGPYCGSQPESPVNMSSAMHDTYCCYSALRCRKALQGFVGDHRQGVTPVPIPNTEVKLLPPMILLSGKVGYRRLYEQRQGKPWRCSFLDFFFDAARLRLEIGCTVDRLA